MVKTKRSSSKKRKKSSTDYLIRHETSLLKFYDRVQQAILQNQGTAKYDPDTDHPLTKEFNSRAVARVDTKRTKKSLQKLNLFSGPSSLPKLTESSSNSNVKLYKGSILTPKQLGVSVETPKVVSKPPLRLYSPPAKVIVPQIIVPMSTQAQVNDVNSSNPSRHFQRLKQRVNQAIAQNKTFTIKGWNELRMALLERGWIEKYDFYSRPSTNWYYPSKFKEHSFTSLNLLVQKCDRNWDKQVEAHIMSKLMISVNHQVDLCHWYDYSIFDIMKGSYKVTKLNLLPYNHKTFCDKTSLAIEATNNYWDTHPYGLFNIKHPKTYNLSKDTDRQKFIQEYRLKTAIGLIQWVVQAHSSRILKIQTKAGKITPKALFFALGEADKYLNDQKSETSPEQWVNFFDCYHKVVHIGHHFAEEGVNCEAEIVLKCTSMLKKLSEQNPNLEVEGMMNTWLVKPATGTRGHGIYMCTSLRYILNIAKANKGDVYIVQKYIERPLLIYKTKFDLRQYFLISSVNPLTIWMYKDSYTKFSSQTYNIRKLHESVHITNNSIQRKYESPNDYLLPSYNMWDCSQLKEYLGNIGLPNIYNRIYNAMCEAVVASVVRFHKNFVQRRGCYQLFGADFLIDDNFEVWLVEINWYPDMAPTTPVTAKVCSSTLKDVIKVVVDYAKDPSADTGQFEMIYKEKWLTPKIDKSQLHIEEICELRTFSCVSERDSLYDKQYTPKESRSLALIAPSRSASTSPSFYREMSEAQTHKFYEEDLCYVDLLKGLEVNIQVTDTQKMIMKEAFNHLRHARKEALFNYIQLIVEALVLKAQEVPVKNIKAILDSRQKNMMNFCCVKVPKEIRTRGALPLENLKKNESQMKTKCSTTQVLLIRKDSACNTFSLKTFNRGTSYEEVTLPKKQLRNIKTFKSTTADRPKSATTPKTEKPTQKRKISKDSTEELTENLTDTTLRIMENISFLQNNDSATWSSLRSRTLQNIPENQVMTPKNSSLSSSESKSSKKSNANLKKCSMSTDTLKTLNSLSRTFSSPTKSTRSNVSGGTLKSIDSLSCQDDLNSNLSSSRSDSSKEVAKKTNGAKQANQRKLFGFFK